MRLSFRIDTENGYVIEGDQEPDKSVLIRIQPPAGTDLNTAQLVSTMKRIGLDLEEANDQTPSEE